MNTSVSHVESPKADATCGQLDGLEFKALAAAQTATVQISQVEDAQSKAAGAEVEAGRKAAGAEAASSAEGNLLMNCATQLAGGGAEILSAASEVLSDRASDPARQIDTAKIAKQTGGVIASGKTTSFEKMFKDIKKGPSVIEKSKIASSSVEAANKSSVPSGVSKEDAGAMQQVKQVALTCGIANEKVLGQIQAVRATPQAPGMGSQPKGMNHSLCNGPKFKEPKDEAASSGEEAWA